MTIALETQHGRITLHLIISSWGHYFFSFVFPAVMQTSWLVNHPQVKFSPKGYATAETFDHFLNNLEDGIKTVFLDQNRYRRSVLANQRHLERFQFLLLPIKTTKHSQPIDQVIHHRLKKKFKDNYDFTTSLAEIIIVIQSELTQALPPHRESGILAGWRIVRRKFPTGSEITRILPPRVNRASTSAQHT
jgi:uncharacterized protein YifN (PemK superfamily)